MGGRGGYREYLFEVQDDARVYETPLLVGRNTIVMAGESDLYLVVMVLITWRGCGRDWECGGQDVSCSVSGVGGGEHIRARGAAGDILGRSRGHLRVGGGEHIRARGGAGKIVVQPSRSVASRKL